MYTNSSENVQANGLKFFLHILCNTNANVTVSVHSAAAFI